jgi:hypothetical protein
MDNRSDLPRQWWLHPDPLTFCFSGIRKFDRLGKPYFLPVDPREWKTVLWAKFYFVQTKVSSKGGP